MHRMLVRQLRKLGLSPDAPPPDAEAWRRMLERVGTTYEAHESDRRLVERAMDLMSAEMTALHDDLRRTSASEIAREHAKLRAVITSLGTGLVVLEPDGTVRTANPEALRLLGAAREEVEGSSFSSFAGHPSPARLDAIRDDVVQLRTVHRDDDALLRRADGQELPVTLALNPVLIDERVESVVLVFTDISERKSIEAAIRHSEAQYRSVVENIREVVFNADAEGRWIFVNPAWTDITGYTRRETIGQSARAFMHPDDWPRVEAHYRNLIAGEADSYRFDVRCLARDGSEHWLQAHVRALTDSDGVVKGFSGTLTDVSDYVRFQSERQARARAEELLRLKSSLLNNMSHELRTPLTAIIGFADILVEEVDPAMQEFASGIRDAGGRLMRTFNAVLELAELEANDRFLRRRIIDAGAHVQRLLETFESDARAKGLFLDHRRPDSVPLAVDPALFTRVLEEVVGNAIKYTDAGSITVETAAEDADVFVRVTDTGIGIASSFMPYLFDAFAQQSTGLSRAYEGNGLGLTLAQRITELLGGELWAESVEGEGSTFTVRLPAHVDEQAPALTV